MSSRAARALSGACVAAALVLSGIGLASPAQAVESADKLYAFSDPSGTDWRVPAGMSKIIVALRGGAGGADGGGSSEGGSGADFSIELDVQPGDLLTVYAGGNATGKKDQRDGGKGFINGGTGGKGSLTGKHAGGGGGAAAVKLNGRLIAVAGGGGGHGGSASYTKHPDCPNLSPAGGCGGKSQKITNAGGIGASADSFRSHSGLGDGSNGSGSAGGAGGAGGYDAGDFKGYKANGQPGSSAGVGTDGGGGGGGGGGWPSSGLGAGAGRKVWGSNGGGGGGAGMSWIEAGVRENSAAARHYDSQMPVWVGKGRSDSFPPSYIFTPGQSKVSLTATGQQVSPTGVAVEVFASTVRTPYVGERGSFVIYDGTEKLAEGNTNDYQTGKNDGRASLYLTKHPSGFLPGEHTFRIEFTPQRPGLLQSTSTLTVQFGTQVGLLDEGSAPGVLPEAELPEAALASVPDPAEKDAAGAAPLGFAASLAEPAETSTEFVWVPAELRAFAPATVTAQVRSAAGPVSGYAELEANGQPVAGTVLDASGLAVFDGATIPAGATELSVWYLGNDELDFLPSVSESQAISVAPSETRLKLNLSRTSVRAGDEVLFTGTVTNADPVDTADPRGAIEVIADDEVLLSIPAGLDCDTEGVDLLCDTPGSGTNNAMSVFSAVADYLPVGSHELTARFVPAPGFAESQSEVVELTVEGVGTRIAPHAAQYRATAGGSVTVPFHATTATGGAGADGVVQAYLDGAAFGAPVAVHDGAAEVRLESLPAGSHSLELRFTPESLDMLPSSATVSLQVAATAGGAGGKAAQSALARTGSDDLRPLAVTGTAALLLGAGALLLAGCARRARIRGLRMR